LLYVQTPVNKVSRIIPQRNKALRDAEWRGREDDEKPSTAGQSE